MEQAGDPLVVVSSDTHIGPLLREQLRDYCPDRYQREFDEFAEHVATARAAMRRALAPARALPATSRPTVTTTCTPVCATSTTTASPRR